MLNHTGWTLFAFTGISIEPSRPRTLDLASHRSACKMFYSLPASKALALAVTASMAAAVPVVNRVEPREATLPIVTAKLDFTHTTCAADAVKRIMQYGPGLSYENAIGPSMMCEFAGGKLCGSTGLTALVNGGTEGDRNTVENCPAM